MTDLLKLIQQRKQETNRQKTVNPPSGRSRWRILPSWRGDGQAFWQDFGQHFIKDATGQVKAVVVCADKTFGKPCTICDAVGHGIMNTTDDLTKKRLEDAKSAARVLVNALQIDGPTPNEPQILSLPPTVFNGNKGVGGILSLFEEWPTLINLADGHDIIIEKSGTGRDTRYGVQIAGASKPVSADVMKRVTNLDNFVQQESDDATRRALTQVSAISGMLPAPSKPTTAAGSDLEDVFVAEVPSTAPVAAPAPVVAVAPAAVAAVAAAVAAPAPAPAPAAPAAKSMDEELDAILADLK